MSNGDPFAVVREFELAVARYTGAPYCVSVNSCTMALLLAVAWHIQNWGTKHFPMPHLEFDIEIPRRTYIGVPYAIREAGGWPVFRDEKWRGMYQLSPLPVWDSARWLTGGMYQQPDNGPRVALGSMQCLSFHWSKTLGIQQGGAILHDNPEADTWFRRARFDGRAEGISPSKDTFPLARAWHAYMAPETAAAGLVRLALLPWHNEPLPWGPGTTSDYPDLSQMACFK